MVVKFVFIMLFYLLPRTAYQTVAEASCKSTFLTAFRTLTTSSPKCEGDSSSAPVVTRSQLKTMLASHDIQLFDVREPHEYQDGRIADAVNMPLGIVEESLKLSPEQFQRNFAVRIPGKDDSNIVFYCKGGNRSFKALSLAHQLGFNRGYFQQDNTPYYKAQIISDCLLNVAMTLQPPDLSPGEHNWAVVQWEIHTVIVQLTTLLQLCDAVISV